MNLTKEPPMKFALERHATVTALALAVSALPVLAEEAKHGARVPLLPLYQQECAACHVAYPPGLLPARSWERLMSGLPKHFGSDASLDAATTRQIANWLAANAGTSRSRRAAAGPYHAFGVVRARARRHRRHHLELAASQGPRQLRRLPHPRQRRSLQ
jgi:hypothetical protein